MDILKFLTDSLNVIFTVLCYQVLVFAIKHATQPITNREIRRDTAVDKIEKIVLETRDLASKSWSLSGSEPRQKEFQNAIIGRLTYLSWVLEEFFPDNSEVLDAWHEFYDACTGGQFWVGDREEEANMGQSVEISAYKLVHTVSTQRLKLSRWKFWK